MKDNEYSRSTEYNEIKEFKLLSREQFNLSNDINKPPVEVPDTGEEYTNTNGKHEKNKNNNSISTDKVKSFTNTLKATTTHIVTVACGVIGAVVILTAVILGNPTFELLNLTSTFNSITYEFNLTDLDENINYYLQIDDDNYSQITISEGLNQGIIENLLDDTLYTIKVIGIDQANNIQEYAEFSIKTLKKINLPDTFIGEFNFPTINDVAFEYVGDIKTIMFEYYFDHFNNPVYRYCITLYDGEDIITSIDAESLEDFQMFEYPVGDVIDLRLQLQIIASIDGEEKTIEEETLIFDFREPNILLGDNLTFVETNHYQLDYNIELYQNELQFIDFTFISGEIEEEPLTVTKDSGTIDLYVDLVASEYTVTAMLYFVNIYTGFESVVMKEMTYTLDQIFNLRDVVVDNASQMLMLNFNLHLPNNELLVIKDTDTNEVFPLDGTASYVEITKEVFNLSYYLTDQDGITISDEHPLSINTVFTESRYEMNYPNPGDYVVTYNQDGTINLYADTTFASDDPNVYYEIEFTDTRGFIHRYIGTQSIIEILNIAKDYYYLQYNVYQEVDGIKYLLNNVYPSGTIEPEMYSTLINATVQDGLLTIEISDSIEFDHTSLQLVNSFGEIIPINEQDIIYDADAYVYRISNIEVDPNETSLKLYILGCNYKYTYDTLANMITIKGDKYYLNEITLI